MLPSDGAEATVVSEQLFLVQVGGRILRHRRTLPFFLTLPRHDRAPLKQRSLLCIVCRLFILLCDSLLQQVRNLTFSNMMGAAFIHSFQFRSDMTCMPPYQVVCTLLALKLAVRCFVPLILSCCPRLV